ncbi:hypothetical protein LCGC14_2230000 [marine sediment metagenome]|uniref:Uncharacterized protein n=1 Tax=marine sediment metagenome TaxID=412755 RepID=A0A0F9G3R4_9ZZZZ
MRVAFNKIVITPKGYNSKQLTCYTRPCFCLGKLNEIYAHGILVERKDIFNQLLVLVLMCDFIIASDLFQANRLIAFIFSKKISSEMFSS